MALSFRAPPQKDEPDIFDVPAAVLCARCGQPDCVGCEDPFEEGSGVVAIVPWERPGPMWRRLWGTARASTEGAESFFAALPDGPVNRAAGFAVLSELLAVASMVLLLVPVGAFVLPSLAAAIVSDPLLRLRALFWASVAIPALAAWMVIAHTAHGVALDVAARRHGGRSQRRRAIRFGLYACGWDLMLGPVGLVLSVFAPAAKTSGGTSASPQWTSATSASPQWTKGAGLAATVRVPTRAATALLQGVYALSPATAQRARVFGTRAAVVMTVVSATMILLFAVLAYRY